MKKLGILLVSTCASFVGCEPKSDTDDQLAQYDKARTELSQQKAKVHALKMELEAAGLLQINDNRSLVTTIKIEPTLFNHTIDIRGSVEAKGNITISPEISARVTKVLVKEGEKVIFGQTLVIQDAEIWRNNIIELSTSLELATTVYERQKKLWDKNIGSEVQYLEAKNGKESLENKLATAKSLLDKTKIKAPFSGVIDNVNVRAGENVQPGQPIIRLVNLADMYINAKVSESYIGKFKQNQEVSISFPSTGMEFDAKISAIGQVIEPKNRTFEIEVMIPSDPRIIPNMITVITVSDYINEKAVTIPTNIIFTDNKGVFVYQLKQLDGNNVAIRTDIILGITAGTRTEILNGLVEGDVIINKGIYDISNGSEVKIVEQK